MSSRKFKNRGWNRCINPGLGDVHLGEAIVAVFGDKRQKFASLASLFSAGDTFTYEIMEDDLFEIGEALVNVDGSISRIAVESNSHGTTDKLRFSSNATIANVTSARDIEVPTQEEAKAGERTDGRMTPERTRQTANFYSPFRSIKDFAADGVIPADADTVLQAAFTALATDKTVKKLVLEPREAAYRISGTMGATLEKDFDLEIATGAIIQGTADFSSIAKLIQIQATDSSARHRIYISGGGKLDGSLRPARTGGAPDLLYITGRGIYQCDIERIWFYSNEDKTGVAGDGGLFFAEGQNLSVRRCLFQGIVDTAGYLSADDTQTHGEGAIFESNVYRHCTNAISSKRQWRRLVAWGEDIQYASVAIFTGEADTGPIKLPGKELIVAFCDIRNVLRGINPRWCDGAKILFNKITDYGQNLADGSASADSAINVDGSSDCLIMGNTCRVVGYSPNAGSHAIRLQSRTFDGTTHHSTNNMVMQNDINTTGRGIYEADSNQDHNRYVGNVVKNASPLYSISGANSTIDKGLENNRRELDYATISLGGSFGSEALRATKTASQVNRIGVTGGTAGNPPQIAAEGSDTNIDLTLAPKGTGKLRAPLANVPNYADDTAAAAGGVPVGGFYRNGSDLMVRAA